MLIQCEKLGSVKKLGNIRSSGGTTRTQKASISADSINGYENLTTDDFFVSITGCYMGNSSSTLLTNGRMDSVSKKYNPNIGVLTVSCVFTIKTSNTNAISNYFTTDIYY